MEYSYSFSEELQQEWNWRHRFSTQPEILEYANHVADRFDLRRYIKFQTRVSSVRYDQNKQQWLLKSSIKEEFQSRFCVMATGTLSSVNEPKFNGIKDYQGDWYITGRWPHSGVDFSGKTVGIIGTGSSAVQAIPVIAKEAKHLTVFQRTANYSIPAKNRSLINSEVEGVKSRYSEIRTEARSNRAGIAFLKAGIDSALSVSETTRTQEYQRRWDEGGTGFTAAYSDIGTSDKANFTAAEFVRNKIRETVQNTETAELLAPTNTIGCKRLCADTDYYETYNRANVTLLDVNSDPIQGLVKEGIQTKNKIYEFDIVIFAIGFDAMTGALLGMNITGKNGRNLKETWSEGPKSYPGPVIVNIFGNPAILNPR
jgi:cyclohexanone monooxygenase